NAKEDKEIEAAVQAFNHEPAPHKEPRLVRAELRERLLSFVFRYPIVPEEAERDDRLVDRELLGKRPSREQWKRVKQALDDFEATLFAAEKQDAVERQLFKHNCTHCHYETKEKRGAEGLPVYEKTNSPDRWLTHARFSHQHHRMLDCTQCHPAEDSKHTRDVLMPSISSCQKCHNPDVGVRNDCVECHNYHDRQQTKEIH